MKLKLYNTISFKLIMTKVIIIFLLFSIFSLFTSINYYNNIKNEAKEKLSLVGTSVETYIKDWENGFYTYLHFISTLDDIKNLKIAASQVILDNAYSELNLSFLIFIGSDGNGLVRANSGTLTNYSDREYFKEAMEGDKGKFSTIGRTTKEPIILYSVPVIDDEGDKIGVIAAGIFLQNFSNLTNSFVIGHTGFSFMVNENGNLLTHPTEKLMIEGSEGSMTLNNYSDYPPVARLNSMTKAKDYSIFTFTDDHGKRWLSYVVKFNENGFGAVVQQKMDEIISPVSRFITYTIVFSVLMVIIVAVVVLFRVRHLLSPLKGLTEQIKSFSHGDLSIRTTVNTKDELALLSNDMNSLSDKMENILDSVKRSARNFTYVTKEISLGNQDLAQRTSEQASSLEEVTASMEEMNTMTQQNMDNALHVENLTNTIITSMEELNEISGEMYEITQVIDSVAFETNLLALNASIEAARAGDYGSGFEVVAHQVKELSERSSTQTKEISQIITKSIEKMKYNLGLVKKSGERVNEISLSSKDQSDSSKQITAAIEELNEFTQQNAGLVEESAAASEEISAQARQLLNDVSFFKTKSDDDDDTKYIESI